MDSKQLFTLMPGHCCFCFSVVHFGASMLNGSKGKFININQVYTQH